MKKKYESVNVPISPIKRRRNIVIGAIYCAFGVAMILRTWETNNATGGNFAVIGWLIPIILVGTIFFGVLSC